jgi:hypothetical protein
MQLTELYGGLLGMQDVHWNGGRFCAASGHDVHTKVVEGTPAG